ncbi:MAG: DUF1415 domain-containing protein [Gammaproteobacteria bacterium]|jgi:hypothetical protein|nr:DUF1415 domain-containing protein [Gammaproteobacteria bacterium]
MSQNHQTITAQTARWVNDVIVAHNFCPFARREVEQQTIHYAVANNADRAQQLAQLLQLCQQLDNTPDIATTLFIIPEGVTNFDDFLDLVDVAERLLELEGYDGTYQLATFHPDYQFADSPADDAANYTNRAPYPTLHILREEGLSLALASYNKPERIPQRNIDYARSKGADYFADLLESIKAGMKTTVRLQK